METFGRGPDSATAPQSHPWCHGHYQRKVSVTLAFRGPQSHSKFRSVSDGSPGTLAPASREAGEPQGRCNPQGNLRALNTAPGFIGFAALVHICHSQT